jgi:hypothetical protein
MNNPMSRKLFQTREAREKLRGMGGILASSPELSQTDFARVSTAEMQARTAIMQEQLRRRELRDRLLRALRYSGA